MNEPTSPPPSNATLNRWLFEAISWVVGALIVLLVLMPVWRYHLRYPILFENILGIFVGVQIMRLIFLHRYVPYMQGVRAKTAVLLFGLILLVIMLRFFSGISMFVKDVGFFSLFTHIDPQKTEPLSQYMQSQLVFFYTAALLGLIVLPVVLLKAIWKEYNHR